MVDEHGAAGEKLKSIISGQPIDWPAQLDDKHWNVADQLGTKPAPSAGRYSSARYRCNRGRVEAR